VSVKDFQETLNKSGLADSPDAKQAKNSFGVCGPPSGESLPLPGVPIASAGSIGNEWTLQARALPNLLALALDVTQEFAQVISHSHAGCIRS